MKLSLNWKQYRLLSPEDRNRFDGWLEDVIGEPLNGAYIRVVRLGEGQIVCERIARDGDRFLTMGDELVTFTTTHSVRSLPPVWPA